MGNICIFDFDGTLVDSIDTLIDGCNAWLVEHNYSQSLDRETLALAHIRDVLQTLGIPLYKFPFLVSAVRKEMGARSHRIHLHHGIKELLENLVQHSKILIVSTNDKNNISQIASRCGILEYIDVIEQTSLFGKAAHIKKIKNQFKGEMIFYIGDEQRDIEAAKKAGVTSVAVSWGMHHETLLEQADYIVHTPKELLNLLRA